MEQVQHQMATRPKAGLGLLLMSLFFGACVSLEEPNRNEKNELDGRSTLGPSGSSGGSDAIFHAVFNGMDLTGWEGDVEGYGVEDGVLVCRKGGGGNLYLENEYDDFVFRFEFKLQAGANNGVGIRSVRGKDAAYHGMEIQILDDTAAQYADLKPYQYHGSVYGVAPAKRGHQNPLGEWNTEEISAIGSQVKVILNGVVITDVDLEEAGRPVTMDNKEHPGLFRSSGAIGFLGHGHRIEFRNIQIQEH